MFLRRRGTLGEKGPNESVTCPHCSYEIKEDVNFCPKCGGKTIIGLKSGVTAPREELRDKLSKMGEEIEKAFSIAAKEIENAFKTTGETIQDKKTRKKIVCPNCGEKNRKESVFCYKCGKMLIERIGYRVGSNEIAGGCCPDCGTKIAGFEL